jgi:hypothetical protein
VCSGLKSAARFSAARNRMSAWCNRPFSKSEMKSAIRQRFRQSIGIEMAEKSDSADDIDDLGASEMGYEKRAAHLHLTGAFFMNVKRVGALGST